MESTNPSTLQVLMKATKVLGFIRCIFLLYNFTFYRLEYMENGSSKGYFLVKRRWVWIVLSPVILPLFFILPALLMSFGRYYKFINSYWEQWIGDHKKDLSLSTKINYRIQLFD